MKNYKKIICILIAVLSLTACSAFDKKDSKDATENAKDINQEDIAFLDDYNKIIKVEYNPSEFTPKVENVTMNSYQDIENIDSFSNINDSQAKALEEKGFFISPTAKGDIDTSEQPFYIYDDNLYKNIPSFITTDTVLHMYHLFYDNFLSNLEENVLFDKLTQLNQKMLEGSIKQYEELSDNEVKELALKNIAYFATVNSIIGQDSSGLNIPEEAKALSQKELSLIEAQTKEESAILNAKIDYSQFKPRGHYTKSEILEKYFKGMMYFGQAGFFEQIDGVARDDLMAMALLMTDTIFRNEGAYDLWADIYDPISFLVDGADDLGPKEFAKLLYGIYGKEPDLNSLLEKDSLASLHKNLQKMPKPKIADFLGYSFRFMPQRQVVDSVLMQNLVDVVGEKNPYSKKPIYTGLELAAVMGSDLAEDIEFNRPEEKFFNNSWKEYPKVYEETKKEFEELDQESWQKNLYRGWLWTLSALTKDFEEGYPSFMQSEAWKTKDLNTMLGSWAELKHDTILYGKDVSAQLGDGGMEDIPKSYVEPNVEVYEKLSWLIDFTSQNLKSRDMLDYDQEMNLLSFKEICDQFAAISIKELNNEELTEDEYMDLFWIGGTIEYLSTVFVDSKLTSWEYLNEDDQKIEIIADLMGVVDNDCDLPANSFFHVGIGPVYEIYVAYPINGKLYLGRGAVFSYRELLDGQRLTDNEFREKLKANPELGIPKWMDGLIEDELQVDYSYDYDI